MLENHTFEAILSLVGSLFLFANIFILWRRKKRNQKIRQAGGKSESGTFAHKESAKTVLEHKIPASSPGLFDALAKTRNQLSQKLNEILLNTKQIDSSFVDSLEEVLYTSDLGPKTVNKLLMAVREKLTRGELSNASAVSQGLREEIAGILGSAKAQHDSGNITPQVILVVGVNGVGKTTSIGKLAHYYSAQNKTVLVVAGDTFRAAASQQLATWGERAKVDLYTSTQTTDPAAVAYEGVQKGVSDHKDVIIIDTAGRLHNKENLMEELKKVKRVVSKVLPNAPHEILLVVDANTGQNAIVQAQQFNESLGLTGLIVTKLDGTAKGGVIVGIAHEIGVGVEFIGVGEKIGDLKRFSADEFVKGLLP